MTTLIDCIGYPNEFIPSDLLEYIEVFSHVLETKAIAYKSLVCLQEFISLKKEFVFSDLKDNNLLSNNLFIFWLLKKVQKTEFLSQLSKMLYDQKSVYKT